MKRHLAYIVLAAALAGPLASCSKATSSPEKKDDNKEEKDPERKERSKVPVLILGGLQLVYKIVKNKGNND